MKNKQGFAFWFTVVALVLGVIAAITFGLSYVLMVAWNAVVPALGGPSLAYWQTFALLLVIQIIGSAFRTTVRAK